MVYNICYLTLIEHIVIINIHYIYIYIYQVGDSTAYVGMSWIIYSNVLAENTEYLVQNTSEYLNTCQSSSLYLYSNKDLILGKIWYN